MPDLEEIGCHLLRLVLRWQEWSNVLAIMRNRSSNILLCHHNILPRHTQIFYEFLSNQEQERNFLTEKDFLYREMLLADNGLEYTPGKGGTRISRKWILSWAPLPYLYIILMKNLITCPFCSLCLHSQRLLFRNKGKKWNPLTSYVSHFIFYFS